MKTVKAEIGERDGYDLEWRCPYCENWNGTETYQEKGKEKDKCFNCHKTVLVKWEY